MNDKIKALAIVAAPIAAIGVYKLLNKEEKKEATYVPVSSNNAGEEVPAPWIQQSSYNDYNAYSQGVSYNPVMNFPKTMNVREMSYTEMITLSGTTDDDFDEQNTYELDEAFQRVDILGEGGDMLVSIRTVKDDWTEPFPVPEGFSSFDFAVTGIKLKSRTSGVPVKYYINMYRW